VKTSETKKKEMMKGKVKKKNMTKIKKKEKK
jgi:hypothetical protein